MCRMYSRWDVVIPFMGFSVAVMVNFDPQYPDPLCQLPHSQISEKRFNYPY